MALVYTGQDEQGNRLEVRSAGATLRLYVDGVLNTQHNRRRGVTGDIWDALALAGLAAPAASLQRILLLGLGGGAVVHLLRDFVAPASRIVAVDSSEAVLELARRFFRAPCEMVAADARCYVERALASGQRFDLVIDDLYARGSDEATRAVPFDRRWRDRLARLLPARRGVLVCNLASRREVATALDGLGAGFVSRFRFATPVSDNAIVALSRHQLRRSELSQRIAAVLSPRQRSQLRLSIALLRDPAARQRATSSPRGAGGAHG